jgi:hypothetical protein
LGAWGFCGGSGGSSRGSRSLSGGLAGESESDSSAVVGLSVSETATTITLLGYNGTGALAGGENTACGCTIGIGGAGTGDELGAWGLSRGGGCRGGSWGSCATGGNGRVPVGEAKGYCGPVIRLGVSEPATAVTLLGDNRAGTFAGSEATASGGAVCISSANTSDELCAGCSSGNEGPCYKRHIDKEESKGDGDLLHFS